MNRMALFLIRIVIPLLSGLVTGAAIDRHDLRASIEGGILCVVVVAFIWLLHNQLHSLSLHPEQ